MSSPFRVVVFSALILAALVGGLAAFRVYARHQSEQAALEITRAHAFGARTMEPAIAWNEGRSPNDPRIAWEVLGTTDDDLVTVSAKTPGREYVFDIDVELKRVHPSNPNAIDLFAELAKQE